MNLIGKIFTVLIFVMSLVFMSFAVAVYATHKNWKEVVTKEDGLVDQLKNAKSRNQELKDEKATLEREMTAEKKAAEQARAMLDQQYQLKKQQFDTLKLKEADLIQQTTTAVEAMNGAQATLASLRGEVEKLRDEILKEQKQKDLSVEEVIRLTDALHQVINELKRLKERQVDLAADLAKALAVLRHYDKNKDTIISETPPTRVEGLVLAVPTRDLVEISIGKDDGLQVGHQLEVYRLSGAAYKYVGRIHVVETHPDRAVCKIDPNFLKSPVQRFDRVISRTRAT